MDYYSQKLRNYKIIIAMKKSTKNLAATLIIGGMFMIPAFCSADTDDDKSENKTKTEVYTKKEVKTQAEIEANEEIKKIAEASFKKTPKIQVRNGQMIAMTVIREIENFTIVAVK